MKYRPEFSRLSYYNLCSTCKTKETSRERTKKIKSSHDICRFRSSSATNPGLHLQSENVETEYFEDCDFLHSRFDGDGRSVGRGGRSSFARENERVYEGDSDGE